MRVVIEELRLRVVQGCLEEWSFWIKDVCIQRKEACYCRERRAEWRCDNVKVCVFHSNCGIRLRCGFIIMPISWTRWSIKEVDCGVSECWPSSSASTLDIGGSGSSIRSISTASTVSSRIGAAFRLLDWWGMWLFAAMNRADLLQWKGCIRIAYVNIGNRLCKKILDLAYR